MVKIYQKLQSFGKALPLALASFCLVVSMFTSLSYAAAASIAQGYTTTDEQLAVGMAASLGSEGSTTDRNIVRTTLSNKGKFVGIVTTKDANLVTLTSSKANVVVTTSGEANAFLTDINGVVKKGDYLTISPLNGILMRADDTVPNIVGSALEDFSVSGSSSQVVKTDEGSEHTVHINTVGVELNARDIAVSNQKSSSFLKALGQNLSGKVVNQWQVLVALIVFLLLLVVEGSLIYGAVHSTITALGRNPLSHDAVYKQLFQVLLAVMAVLAFGLATIYTVLQI